MTIKEIVQKAVDGGYVEAPTHTFITANQYWVVWKDGNGSDYTIALQVYLLDPNFWQAVGRVEGWDTVELKTQFPFMSNGKTEGYIAIETWKNNMLAMTYALAEGKTIEQFLATL